MFSVDNDSYDWGDVALAAVQWVSWQALERQVADGVACRARAAREGLVIDTDSLRARAERFRHARRLLSADEMNAWLQRWHLSTEAWMDHLRRAEARHAIATGDGKTTHPPPAPPIPSHDDAALMHAEAVCSGRLEAWASKLAGRAAAHAAVEPVPVPVASGDHASPEEVAGRSAPNAGVDALGLPPIPPDVRQARIAHLATLERSFHRYTDSVVTPEAIVAEVRARQVDWVRLDCEYVTVPAEDAGREVALSLRRRERTLDELAHEAGVDRQRRTLRVDAVAPDLGAALVSARPGEVVGPLRRDHGFLVLEVLAKSEPSPDDPEIREEAARQVLDRAVLHLVNERVVWHDPL